MSQDPRERGASSPEASPAHGLPVEYQRALVETMSDLDVVTELINRNLRQEDIGRILLKLSSDDRDLFIAKLGEVFRKTTALLLVSRRLSDSLSIDVLLPRMVELISDFLEAERCTIFLHDPQTDELYTKAAVGLHGEIRFPSGQGIAGAVFKGGRAVHIPDVYADPTFNPEIDSRTGFRTRNMLCVPLRHVRDGEAQIVGVVQVLNKRRGGFSEGDLRLLESLSSQAAPALANALLYEEIKRARAEEVQLLEVTTALSTELELRPLLVKIMSTAAMILEADRATLFVHEPRTRELWAVAGQEEGREEVRSPSHIEIAAEVFATGRTINIPDASADTRVNPELDRRIGYQTRSILCVAVLNRKGEVIAVAEVLNKRGGPFTRIDERRLAAFAAQAAIAMENARLFQELNQIVHNLRLLLDASKALAEAVDLDSQLEVILARATEVMEAERSSIFIYDETTQTLWNRVSGALARGQVRVPLGVGIAGHVAQTRELLNIPDAYRDPRFNPKVDKETSFRTRSILCAPMFTHSGRLIGVIQVLNKTNDRVFTRDDEALLEAFASHAAVALDRAKLVEAFLEKERIEESLRLAHEIQMGMLPRVFPERREFELAARLSPARSVGGDLYDFLLDGSRLWFLVGDVSGKGVGAALFMAVTKTLLRASLRGESSPSVVLSRVNRELCRDNERFMFVTAFLGCLDVGTGELLFCNAGHNPPYWLGRDGSVRDVEGGHGLALGILEGHEYQTGRLRLEPGDGLYLYTDGVTEALNGDGEQFSVERLEAHLRGVTGAPASRVVEGTLTALREFVGEAPQFDDITVMSVRYLAG